MVATAVLAVGWTAFVTYQNDDSDRRAAQSDAESLRLNHPGVYQPSCEIPKDAEEADLCAQRDMARAAERLVDLTFWQLVAGAISVGLIWATFRQTRRAADIAEHGLRGLERPYIFVKIAHTQYLKNPGTGRPKIDYKLVNKGKTPAILRRFSIGLLDTPEMPLNSTFEVERKIYKAIGADEEHPPGDGWITVVVESSKPGQAYAGADAANLVLYGLIEYDDPTEARHLDSVCMRGLPGGGFSLEGMDDYNWHHTEYPRRNRKRFW